MAWLTNAVRLLSGEGWHHLVLALLHTLWQGGLAAAALWATLRWIPVRRATLRYAATLAAFGGVVITGVVTWAVLDHRDHLSTFQQSSSVAVPENTARGPTVPAPVVVKQANPDAIEPLPPDSPAWIAWVGAAWLSGLAVMLIRLAASLWSVTRLRRESRLMNDGSVCELLMELSRALAVARRVRLAVSDRIQVPVVVGVIWPLVLLPASALGDVPVEQLRLILAHELAHIRRWDYLVNLLQMLAEAVLFFNPAVWWISRQVRVERESCCDAVAVEVTGERIGYAEALVDWAAQLKDSTPLAALASAPPKRSGTLLDRIRRIVTPESQPQMRMPWYSSVVVMVLSLVLLAALRGGAIFAVEKLMTPQERIEKLVEIEKTHGIESDSETENHDRVTSVTGVVRTEDGSPIPPKLQHTFYSHHGNGVTADDGIFDLQGHFSLQTARGTLWAVVRADGYSPSLTGPLTVGTNGPIKDLQIVLKRGYAGRIRLADAQGRPITGGTIAAILVFENSWFPIAQATSGADGVAVFEHCPVAPLRLEVTAAGYQFEVMRTAFKQDQTMTWTLMPAAPTTGIVVSATDGSPIAGARIGQAGRWGYEDTSTDPGEIWAPCPLLATSGADGRFVLTTLRDAAEYMLYVSAPNHGGEIVPLVFSGQKSVTVKLGPPRLIRGKVLGDIKLLETPHNYYPGSPHLGYTRHTEYRGSFSYGTSVPLTVHDGSAIFEITDLPPCTIELEPPAPVQPQKFNLIQARAVGGVVIDLRPPKDGGPKIAQPKMRRVVLQFVVPPGSPFPRGKIQLYNPTGGGMILAAIDDKGRVESSQPVLSRLNYSGSRELIGYWIKNDWVDVPDGDGPLVVNVNAQPAGAIYGRVLNPDGTPCRSYSVSVQVMEPSAETPPPGLFDMQPVNGGEPEGRFVYTPLVLGGRYRAVVTTYEPNARAAVVSEVLAVDANHPMHKIELHLVRGVTVAGEVRDPAGKPILGMEVLLNLRLDSPSGSYGAGGMSQRSDPQGRFGFLRVNPDVPGVYTLEVRPGRGFRGTAVKVTPDGRKIIVSVQPGMSIKGTVIDDATGRPIPNAKVYATPQNLVQLPFWGGIEVRSDGDGNFQFDGLEDEQYRLGVNEAYPAGAVVTRAASGTTTVNYPPNVAWPEVPAGRAWRVKLRVTLGPDSSLRPEP